VTKQHLQVLKAWAERDRNAWNPVARTTPTCARSAWRRALIGRTLARVGIWSAAVLGRCPLDVHDLRSVDLAARPCGMPKLMLAALVPRGRPPDAPTFSGANCTRRTSNSAICAGADLRLTID